MSTDDAGSTIPGLGAPGSRRRRTIFFAVSGAIAVAVLWSFREVLTPFALALVVAYVLAPLVNAICRLRIGRWPIPRWVAVVALYVALLGMLAAAVALGVPRTIAEMQKVGRELPATIHTLQEEWLPRVEGALQHAQRISGVEQTPVEEDAARLNNVRVAPHPDGGWEVTLPPRGIAVVPHGEGEYRVRMAEDDGAGRRDLATAVTQAVQRAFRDTERYAGTLMRSVQTFVTQVVGGVFRFFIMLMLSAYMLITSDRILAFFRAFARPDRRDRFDALVARIDRGLAGVVRGQLLIALVNGVLSGVGFWLADLKYWPVLTLIATLLSIIPIFGAIISSIPAVIVGLQNGVGTALFTLAWIVGIHQLEANVLNPKIMGDAAKVHPVLVVFALLAGEHVYGIVGALLAVPVLSITQSLFLHLRESWLSEQGSAPEPERS
ncbi:MAG: AI-2E family transporter [Sandaracinaceae bacterium]|nr:AI-2E family transporter [Sandaracinaceae bacterium]